MAALSIQTADADGLEVAFATAAAGGDSYANDGQTVLLIKNGSASAITATITAQSRCSLGTLHNLTVTVGAGKEVIVNKLPPSIYNDASGNVLVGYSAVTSVTVAAIKVA